MSSPSHNLTSGSGTIITQTPKSKSQPVKRALPWRFTINNPTDQDRANVQALTAKATYWIYGDEVGEEGTPHLQGLVVYKSKKSMKQVSADLPRANVDISFDPPAMDVYCQKEGKCTVMEDGRPPMSKKSQGLQEKKRYERAWDLAKAGDIEAIDADIRMRLYGTIKRIRADYQVVPASSEVLDFHWYTGESGTGKSRAAREENPGYFVKNINKWWDGYVDQKCVLIEEWNPQVNVSLQQYLKSWLDHHPFSAETKGSTICIRPPKIIVTSNYTLEECFGHDQKGLLDPIKRRVTVKHFGTRYLPNSLAMDPNFVAYDPAYMSSAASSS